MAHSNGRPLPTMMAPLLVTLDCVFSGLSPIETALDEGGNAEKAWINRWLILTYAQANSYLYNIIRCIFPILVL